MKSKTSFLLFGITLFLTSCYYDHFNELHPLDGFVETCDDALPDTYTGVTKNILLLNCVSCHNSNTRNGDVNLETYDLVKQYVDNGKLMGSVLHESGYQAMPPGTKLRDCDIQQLQQWINNGMLQ
jgi:mono/diheme cytochrome c family protein